MSKLAILALAAAAGVVSADFTDFSSDVPGDVPNGFASVDALNIVFSDTMGSDLRLNDWGIQSDGIGLAVAIDDPGRLRMDFIGNVSDIFLDFGNDAGYVDGDGDLWAWMIGFNGGFEVDSIGFHTNEDDILNETIGLTGNFDAAEFYYGDSFGNAVDHAEIVDNVRTTPIPSPSAAALLGLGGLLAGRRRR